MRNQLGVFALGAVAILSIASGCGSDNGKEAEKAPLPSFEVNSSLTPHSKTIAGVDDGPERELGSVSSPSGGQADFVLNEVSIVTKDKTEVEALAVRWNGHVVKDVNVAALADPASSTADVPHVYLVAIDASLSDASHMPADLRTIDDGARGKHRVSSDAALHTLAAAAKEAAEHPGDSFQVAVNFMLEPSGTWDGKSKEHAAGDGRPYSPNAYDAATWRYLQQYRVPQAWEALSAAGKLGNRVKIMVMDGGFVPNPDFPQQATMQPANKWKVQNPEKCTGGTPCPWHATDTVTAAMGQLDNGFGAAGPAGPIAELIAVQSPSWDIFQIVNWLFEGLGNGLLKGPRIINISATGKIPGVLGFALKPLDFASTLVRGRFLGINVGQGSLLFAAAGNAAPEKPADDVDHEDCFGFCWESDVYAPCEADDAVCIGGTTWNDWSTRSPGSNYGKQQRVDWKNFADPGRQDNSVDLYAPFEVWVGPTPDAMGNPGAGNAHTSTGTSVASPFAAGVAALVFAADPTLTADQVYEILLQTANSDTEKLRIDAYAAVKLALAKQNQPPQLLITSPTNGATLPAGIQGVELKAEAKDLESGPSNVSVEWTSDQEGVLGTGLVFTHEFKKLGTHHITATARDPQGATSQQTIDIALWDTPPVATILAPTSGESVTRGVPFLLQGEVVENFQHLGCSFTSSSSLDLGFPLSTCTGAVTFTQSGTRTVTLSGKDSYGNLASTSVTFDVIEPVPNSPPVAVITSPTPEQSLTIGTLVSLSGNAVDPDGKAVTYEWRFQGDACAQETVIATGANPTWDTGLSALQKMCGTQQSSFGTLRLYATDADQSVGVTSVHVYLAYPPT